MEQTNRTCRVCGAQALPNSDFCPVCGRELARPRPAPPVQQPPPHKAALPTGSYTDFTAAEERLSASARHDRIRFYVNLGLGLLSIVLVITIALLFARAATKFDAERITRLPPEAQGTAVVDPVIETLPPAAEPAA
ncbi:MAG: hypothetical protein QM270_07510 [Bacillota bacterium]|nr:hypothetical protein [Bacillota bacterium]